MTCDVAETSENTWQVAFVSEYGMFSNHSRFVFRVRARNRFGWSRYSEASNVIDVSQIHSKQSASRQAPTSSALIGALVGAAIVLTLVVSSLFYLTVQRRTVEKVRSLAAAATGAGGADQV